MNGLTVQQEEEQKAITYRNQWDRQISYRAWQMRRYQGNEAAYQSLWKAFDHVYRPTNYIENSEIYEEFFTPWDTEEAGGQSKSEVKLAGAKQSRRQEPGTAAGA